MQLIGMLDSPYVRRVAISLQLLGLRFEHRSISVFSTFQQFREINPVVKAPSLICDDGELLMDSTLIIEYAEALAAGRKSLVPSSLQERQHTLREIGLALAACEKSIQIVYERNPRNRSTLGGVSDPRGGPHCSSAGCNERGDQPGGCQRGSRLAVHTTNATRGCTGGEPSGLARVLSQGRSSAGIHCCAPRCRYVPSCRLAEAGARRQISRQGRAKEKISVQLDADWFVYTALAEDLLP
jgi:hypothetical protein